jgi:hypothetical protein
MALVLDELNTSELLLLAQEHNLNVHRGLDRAVLYAIILGEDVDLPERRVDKYRLRIMGFINEHWKQVEPLVRGCPAGTRDPRACFQCTDVQVVECMMTNAQFFPSKKE